ncbi:MAG: helix-turn-helix transcriptional regulator [Coriobacteriales bacterium]|jgi:DNA-binding CsgD family transcriptional regulator|nr:helix-turn-helix transcriptional regulator [Coriobacteriales bacterium]
MSNHVLKSVNTPSSLDTKLDRTEDFASPISVISGQELCGIVGTALSWAWYFAVFFSGIVILPLDPLLRIEPLFRLAGLVGIATGYILLILLNRQLIKRPVRIFLFIFASIIPVALIALSTVSIRDGISFYGLGLACWMLAGLSVSFFTMNQILFLGTSDNPPKRYYHLAASLILGALFYLPLSTIHYPLNMLFLALFPALSAACFYLANHSEHVAHSLQNTEQRPLSKVKRGWVNVIPNWLSYGVVFGLSLNIAISKAVDITGEFSWITGIALCLPGPILLLLLLAQQGKLNTEHIQWTLIVLMTIALVVSLLLDSWWIIASLSITAFCFVLFQGIYMIVLSEFINEEQKDGLIVLLVSMTVVSLGIMLGWAVGCFMLIDSSYESDLFPWSIAITAILLILSLAWQGRPHTNDNTILHLSRKQDLPQGRWKRSISSICEQMGLSKRQSEIFAYLAKGRNASSIARELIVSEHTVKAHIYRIYQKLEVHSQQELIDLVEKQMRRQ